MQRTPLIQPTTTVEALVEQEEIANDRAIWVVFRKMLFFTMLMTLAPIASFFVSKSYFFDVIFDNQIYNTNIYSAVVAVLVVHAVLFAFIYVAFRDDGKGKKDRQKQATGKKD